MTPSFPTIDDGTAIGTFAVDEEQAGAAQDARLAKIKHLVGKLRQTGWRRDTSYWPDRWLADRPSTGQCAVTALVIQDQFGGEIVEAATDRGEVHFFNRLPDLGDIDLTADQFDPSVTVYARGVADREVILSVQDTVRRYNLLKHIVQEHA